VPHCGRRIGLYLMQEMTDDQSTRERMLETIDRLFYRQGIRAVGVDAIVAELGISKKILYGISDRRVK
jgi:AcrR family transcriptional regulator